MTKQTSRLDILKGGLVLAGLGVVSLPEMDASSARAE